MNENPQQGSEPNLIDPSEFYLKQIEENILPEVLDAKVAEANKTFADLQDPGLTTIRPDTQIRLKNHIISGDKDPDLDPYLVQIINEMKRGVLDVKTLDPDLLKLLDSKRVQTQESIPA